MSDAPKLSPELVVMAIQAGLVDDGLPIIAQAVKSRRENVANTKAYSLKTGDRFITQNISPKKWDSLTVTFERHEGIWLVCRLDEHDRLRLGTSSQIKLRTTHVGTLMPKGM